MNMAESHYGEKSHYGVPPRHYPPACPNAWENGYCSCYYCAASAAPMPQHHQYYHHHQYQQRQQNAAFEGHGVVWGPQVACEHYSRSMEYYYEETVSYPPPNHFLSNSMLNRPVYQTREEDLLHYQNQRINLVDSLMKTRERGNQEAAFARHQEMQHCNDSKEHQDQDDARLAYALLLEEQRSLSQQQEQSQKDADYARALEMQEMLLLSNSRNAQEDDRLVAIQAVTTECKSYTEEKVREEKKVVPEPRDQDQTTALAADKPKPAPQQQETQDGQDNESKPSVRSDAQVAQDLLEEESQEKRRRPQSERNDFPVYTRVPTFQRGTVCLPEAQVTEKSKTEVKATPQASTTDEAAKAEAIALALQKREAASAYTTMATNHSAHSSINNNSCSSLSTGFMGEEKIAGVAKFLERLDDEDDQPWSSQFHLLQQEVDMHASLSGRAWKFVEQVQQLFLNFGSSGFLEPVSLDKMVEQTEKLLDLQHEFQCAGKAEGCLVDLAYHYSQRENLDQIQMNGLLSKGEQLQTPHVRTKLYNGSVYGDGIYTGNNPFKFHGRYGDMGLLVARLKGKTSYHPREDHENRTRWEDGVDTKLIGTPPEDVYAQRVLLRRSAQCIPLFSFSASDLSIVQPRASNNLELQRLHENLLVLVDRFFNNDMVQLQ